MSKRIFVDNCAPATTPESLTEHFKSAGKVASVDIPADKNRGAKEVHAFIVMASTSEAAAAIQMFNGSKWNGHNLTVTQASSSQSPSGFSGGNNRLERKNR